MVSGVTWTSATVWAIAVAGGKARRMAARRRTAHAGPPRERQSGRVWVRVTGWSLSCQGWKGAAVIIAWRRRAATPCASLRTYARYITSIHCTGACASLWQPVSPNLRSEGGTMAELHSMEMGWSGSGWMDPLPGESTAAPSSSSGGSATRPVVRAVKARRAKRKVKRAVRRAKRTVRKTVRRAKRRVKRAVRARKATKKAAKRSARRTVKKAVRRAKGRAVKSRVKKRVVRRRVKRAVKKAVRKSRRAGRKAAVGAEPYRDSKEEGAPTGRPLFRFSARLTRYQVLTSPGRWAPAERARILHGRWSRPGLDPYPLAE